MESARKNPSATKLAPLEWGEVELLRRLRSTDGDLEELAARLGSALRSGTDLPPGFEALASEAHALGWLHQHVGKTRRDLSFRAEHQIQAKHADVSTTTQLYTPRWVADILAQRCFELAGPVEALDPACGAGQMLLAWVDALIASGVQPAAAFGMIRGIEIDPAAAEVGRDVLQCHARRRVPDASDTFLSSVRQRISVGDGLADTEPAPVVLCNPPYMGARSMPPSARAQLQQLAPFDADLSAAFIRRCIELSTCCCGVLAQQTFWFVKTFEQARRETLKQRHLDSFVHLGPGVFRSLTGEKAAVVAFVLSCDRAGMSGFYDYRALAAPEQRQTWPQGRSELAVGAFKCIPGFPLAHWLSTPLRKTFDRMPALGDLFEIPPQNKTGNNKRFVRRLVEVGVDELALGEASLAWEAPNQARAWLSHDAWFGEEWPMPGRWALYSKGGPAAPWWGGWDHAVDISLDARVFYRTNRTSNLVGASSVLRPGLCYTDFGGRNFSARRFPAGAIADMTGPAIFDPMNDLERLDALMAVLNASPARAILNALNPSLHYQVGDVRHLPTPEPGDWVPELAGLAARTSDLVRSVYSRDDRTLEGRIVAASSRDASRDSTKSNLHDIFETICALEHQIEARVADLYGVEPMEIVRHVWMAKLRKT